MTDRPILFSGPMVRALLDGSKTQTRRVIKDQSIGERFSHMTDDGRAHLEWLGTPCCGTGVWDVPEHSAQVACPYGQPGDRLWVREAWRASLAYELTPPREITPGAPILYQADGAGDLPLFNAGKLRPGMFMPRWASRITPEITGVRVERLWGISDTDVRAEGCEGTKLSYAKLWESINSPGSWDANPWVWVVEFRRQA